MLEGAVGEEDGGQIEVKVDTGTEAATKVKKKKKGETLARRRGRPTI